MRRLLLDTHALLWWLSDDPTLRTEARSLINDRDNHVAVSAATVWEIAIKTSKGKLRAPDQLERAVLDAGLSPLVVTLSHAERAGKLPRLHNDPFDRLLVAQAQTEHLEILTRDPRLRAYDVRLVAA